MGVALVRVLSETVVVCRPVDYNLYPPTRLQERDTSSVSMALIRTTGAGFRRTLAQNTDLTKAIWSYSEGSWTLRRLSHTVIVTIKLYHQI